MIVDLADVSDTDLPLVGGKAGKLGEMIRQGLPVPPGFVVTTEAYQSFVDATVLKEEIPGALATLDLDRPESVDAVSRRIRDAFESTEFPEELRKTLEGAFEAYSGQHEVRFSAVRSSATAEDLEGASFAGLQETYLNVKGTDEVLGAIRRCWGSLFTPRVLVYRTKKGFNHLDVRLAVLIQKMVDSVVSGILFTRDPNTGENHMIIEAGWGSARRSSAERSRPTTTSSTAPPSASSRSRSRTNRSGSSASRRAATGRRTSPRPTGSARSSPTSGSSAWPRSPG